MSDNTDRSADSLAFGNQSLAVFAINLGVLPEAGKFFRWEKRITKLSERVVYLTGGEPGRVAIAHGAMGPLLSHADSPDTARREVAKCLKAAERGFALSGFWLFSFERGDIHMFDRDGNRTNDHAKADKRATVYFPTEYWLTDEGVHFLRTVHACALEADLFKFNLAGRNKTLRDIIESYFSRTDANGARLYLPITPDKSPKSNPTKAETENGGITVTRTISEALRLPRRERVDFAKDFIEAMTGHLISDSQDYAEGAHILSKMKTVVAMGQHQLDDLRQRIAKLNGGRPPASDSRAAALRVHQDNAAATLANFEQWAIQADMDGLPEVADCWRHFASSLRDLRWAINVTKREESDQ